MSGGMNVLIFVPLHPRHGIRRRALAALDALDVTGHSVHVHFNAEPAGNRDPFDVITAQYQQARSMVLAGHYDAMLTVEYDNIVPPDALQRLAAVDADVAYGLYCNRRVPHGWLAMIEITWAHGVSYGRNEPTARAAWGNVVESQGVGFGCTLIHRRVLEQIPMRREAGHPCANDWFFAMDCRSAGLRQAHDCGCVVGHILSNNYSVVWPDASVWPPYRIEVDDMLKAKAIQASTGQQAYICNDCIYYEPDNAYYQPGERIVLEPEQAQPLVDSGALTPENEVKPPADVPAQEK